MYFSQYQIYLTRAGLYGRSVVYFINVIVGLFNDADDSLLTFLYSSLISPSFDMGVDLLETWPRAVPNDLDKLVVPKARSLYSLKGYSNIELPVSH